MPYVEIVRVKGKLMRPHGGTATPWVGAEIIVLFCGYTQTQFTQRPSDRTTITTAFDGSWFVDLWTNALGDYQSYYLFQFPHTKNLRVALPNGLPAENEFSGLLLNSTPASDPEYSGLLQLVQDYLGSATLGTADQVALNPVISGLGGTVQTAIATLHQGYTYTQLVPDTEWIVNHNFGFYPAVNVFNFGGMTILADVVNVSINQLRIYFSAPMSGIVKCSY